MTAASILVVKMIPTPYQELNEVLDELVSRLEDILGDNFIGAYLQGSFAVGDFDEHSDADFIVLLGEDLSRRQVEALQVMHDEVYHLGPEWAKRNLDPSWSALIEGAWGGRPDPASKVKEHADAEAYEMTLRFVEYVMSESERFMAEQSYAKQVAGANRGC